MDSSLFLTCMLVFGSVVFILGCCICSLLDPSQKGQVLFKLIK